MSNERSGRFKQVEKSIAHVRTQVDSLIDESIEAGNEHRGDVREAIGDAGARTDNVRKRTDEYDFIK